MSKNKQLIYISVLFLSIVLTLGENSNGTLEFDGSFFTFCAARGKYAKRNFDHSENGDLCTIEYPIKTEGEKEAERFCKVALPYRLHEVKHGEKTTCVAESLIICPSNYQQIDGQCFQLADEHEHYTYDEAVKICEKKNATIARLKKSKTSAYWKYYYPELSMVWVNVSNDIAALSIHNEGDKYAVLYSSAVLFRKRRHSLVQIDGISNRGLVMCEKPHNKTGAFTIQKMKKYSEIYYDNVVGGKTGYFRTSNRYWRVYGDQSYIDNVCKKVAKPFAYNDEEGYTPYNLKDVEKIFGDNLIISRSVLILPNRPEIRNKQECYRFGYKAYDTFKRPPFYTNYPIGLPNYYHDPCDNQWSYGYFKVNETMVAKMASDAMRAPFLCQSYLSFTRKARCSDFKDAATYIRPNGDVVCHQLFRPHSSWEESQNYCQEQYGGFLSGFTSEDEFNLLKSLKGDFLYVWIGGRRTKECLWDGVERNDRGWDDDLCTKAKPRLNWHRYCLEVRSDGLHAWTCNFKQPFICQRPAIFTYAAQGSY